MAKRVSVDEWLFGVTLLLVFHRTDHGFQRLGGHRQGSLRLALQFHFEAALVGGCRADRHGRMMNFDYRRLKSSSVVFTVLGLTTLLLLAVFFLDRHANTHRWIRLGGFSLQPSELAKPAIILVPGVLPGKALQEHCRLAAHVAAG